MLYSYDRRMVRSTVTLEDELRRRINDLLTNLSSEKTEDFAKWFRASFPVVFGSITPRGLKNLKRDAAFLYKFLENSWMFKDKDPEYVNARTKELKTRWEFVAPHVSDLVKYFSNEGKEEGSEIPVELKVGANIYINDIGFSKSKLEEYAASLEKVWNDLKGWRRKALVKGLTVKFARPQEFHGTSGGVYKRDRDWLLVRSIPKVLRRTGGTYGALDYILIHELGHRYARHFSIDEEKFPATTPYSLKEGEAFAELFALGHFGITSAHRTWDPKIQQDFEAQMTKT